MKNKDVYTLYEGLAEISQDKELKFNIQTSYTLAKNKNFLEPLYGAITETRQKIIKKYASLQENGDLLIPKEKIEDFQKDWDNFMNIDNFVSLQHIKLDSDFCYGTGYDTSLNSELYLSGIMKPHSYDSFFANNKYIYTKNISAGGGSIGGVGISSGGLSFPSAGYIKIGDKSCTLASTPLVAWVNAWLTSNSSSRTVTSIGTMRFNFSDGSSNVYITPNN